MSTDGVDLNRRHFLTVATTVVGGVGMVAAAVPFVASMKPSARAKAAGAPVELDISKIEPGGMAKIEWRGKAVGVVRRTPRLINLVESMDPSILRDPKSLMDQQPPYAANEMRSIKPEYFVTVLNCTHLGCAPKFVPEVAPEEIGPQFKGGFFCPCHGSKFDLAGRVFKGVPAPLNLLVPPHRYLSPTTLQIGEDGGAA